MSEYFRKTSETFRKTIGYLLSSALRPLTEGTRRFTEGIRIFSIISDPFRFLPTPYEVYRTFCKDLKISTLGENVVSFREYVRRLPLSVVIMAVADGRHLPYSRRHPKFFSALPIFSDLFRTHVRSKRKVEQSKYNLIFIRRFNFVLVNR